MQKFLIASNIPQDALGEVAHVLEEHDEPIRPGQLKERVNASAAKRTRAVNLLEQAETVATTPDGRLEYLDPGLPAEQAVELAKDAAVAHQRLLRSRIQMIHGYAETTGCRRQYLLRYFSEHLPHPCGNCDNCEAGTAENQPADNDRFPINSSVQHTQWGHGVVISIEHDRLTVLFEEFGYKTLSLQAIEQRDLLSSDDTPGRMSNGTQAK